VQIKREIYKTIKAHLSRPEITLLVGPRQVGKTTLITKISEELQENGSKVVFLNLDVENDFALLDTQARLLNHLELEIGTEKGFVFIDEVQRKKDAGRFFKGIYDMNLPYKFILTGSGSVELKEKISESLAGRKQLFEMVPVTFIEFLDYKTDYKYSTKMSLFISNKDPRIELLFEEYLKFGGYPRIILSNTLERKRMEMQEICRSYLEKDLVQLLNIRKTEKFTKLVTVLASQIGNKVNVNELSNTLGLDNDTISNYLWYLEKTYILQICTPYYTNTRSELTKTPLYYFVDSGMRNYALHRFTNFDFTLEGGHMFENFIFNYLKNKYLAISPTINYWRTKDGAEIDFILRTGENVIPIEAKYRGLKKTTLGKSFYSFLSKYHPKKAYVLNLTLNAVFEKEGSEIIFKGFPDFLIENVFTE
jgi:uncharacterized protein